VCGAVGIGVWALLVLSRAARTALAEQATANGGGRGQADLWLAAAIGLFVLAIGYGFTAGGSNGPRIAAGLLQAVGVAVLAGAVVAARSRGMLGSRPVPFVLIGLALYAVSFLALAIVAGLDFGTLGALSASLTIVAAVGLAAVVILGYAAWTQVRVLYPAAPRARAGAAAGGAPGGGAGAPGGGAGAVGP
jgi:membrane-bound metal-dependent hydrolase YbcI (DUF457 family)